MDPLTENRPDQISIRREHWETMIADAARRFPQEACGLLAGKVDRRGAGQSETVIPVTNALHSEFRYRMAPEEQLRAFQFIDEKGLELLAIYHSHPKGPDHPSATDISQAYYPEAAYLIWFQREETWQCRGFHIQDGLVEEIHLLLLDIE